MISEQLIKDLTNTHLEGSDRFAVSVAVRSDNRIRIFIDSDTHVLIEHCIELSKFIESQLDREKEDFELNVSSSGLDQPYKLPRQYMKNIGREVAVLMKDNNKIEGALIAADAEGFTVKEITKVKKINTETIHSFLYSDIKETKEIIKI
ncbi:MAG: ribosome assembly cofactor RimP [Bacteroidota bacterium]